MGSHFFGGEIKECKWTWYFLRDYASNKIVHFFSLYKGISMNSRIKFGNLQFWLLLCWESSFGDDEDDHFLIPKDSSFNHGVDPDMVWISWESTSCAGASLKDTIQRQSQWLIWTTVPTYPKMSLTWGNLDNVNYNSSLWYPHRIHYMCPRLLQESARFQLSLFINILGHLQISSTV